MQRIAWLVVALLVAVPAFSQDEGGRPRRPGGQDGPGQGRGQGRGGFGQGRFGFGGPQTTSKISLLGSEQVLAEIKATDEQKPKIAEAVASWREESGALTSGLRDIPREERQAKMEEINKKRAELDKKADASVVKLLEKEQNARLDQIVLQQKGVQALSDEAVVAALKISEEQQKKIKTAVDDETKKRAELLEGLRGGGGGGGGFAEIREKMTALTAETEKAALAALTEEQRAAFVKMKGEKFELERRGFGGGRGGARRGGAEGGGEGGEGGRRRRPQPDEI